MNKKKQSTDTGVYAVYVYINEWDLVDSALFAYRKDAEAYVTDHYDEQSQEERIIIVPETVWLYR